MKGAIVKPKTWLLFNNKVVLGYNPKQWGFSFIVTEYGIDFQVLCIWGGVSLGGK
jgi:hypothetical protein